MNKQKLGSKDLESILQIVCSELNVEVSRAKQKIRNNKKERLVDARYIYFHFARKFTKCTTTEIALLVGKNHSVVSTSIKTFNSLIFSDKTFRQEVKNIETEIKKQMIKDYKECTRVETKEYILLSIELWDNTPASWEELQEIKKEVFGDYNMVEIYPKENNIINNANVRHLYYLKGVSLPCLTELENEREFKVEFL